MAGQGDPAERQVPGEPDREAGRDDGGPPAVQVPGQEVDRADAERAAEDGRQAQRERVAAEQRDQRRHQVPEAGRLLEDPGGEERPVLALGEHPERFKAALRLVEPDALGDGGGLPQSGEQRERQQDGQRDGVDAGPAGQQRAGAHAGGPPERDEEEGAGEEVGGPGDLVLPAEPEQAEADDLGDEDGGGERGARDEG